MKWFKLHNDIIHDPKVRCLAFEDRWHFVALMCLTNDGTLDEPIEFRHQLMEIELGLTGIDLSNLKQRLQRLGLINDDWKPRNWDKRQESKDTTGAERQRRYREAQKASKRDAQPLRNGSVTSPLRTEEEVEEEYIAQKNAREINIEFDEFWRLYPRKVGKKNAQTRWTRLTNKSREEVIEFLIKKPYADRDKNYTPHGDTFLSKRFWEDDDLPANATTVGGVEHFS